MDSKILLGIYYDTADNQFHTKDGRVVVVVDALLPDSILDPTKVLQIVLSDLDTKCREGYLAKHILVKVKRTPPTNPYYRSN